MRPITANDLMNPNVLVVRDEMSVKELAAFLMDNEITGAPVEDPRGKLVGVVSVVDIVRAAASTAADGDGDDAPDFFQRSDEAGLSERDRELLDRQNARRTTVADIMTPVVYSVSEDAEVSEIAATLLDHHLHRLLVTSDDQPVGIISTSDLLGLLIDEDDD